MVRASPTALARLIAVQDAIDREILAASNPPSVSPQVAKPEAEKKD